MEEDKSTFNILTGKPTGRKTLGRPRRRWDDNIRMDLKEMYQYEEFDRFGSG